MSLLRVGLARPSHMNTPSRFLPSRKEDGCGFLAIAPDLPGCLADGWTQREALANLHDAIAEWIADARAMGRPVPEPKYYLAA